ncbi:uncharacterized protein FOMMEDRAFT_72951, partial [Fomitiporia mediterranea MF3/22]|uniref:uncharacterized protein n=1 Tax=Fomitiporia mediterranea (strain MF3/22) TaxID=694068 RepID=UPI0004408F5B
GLPPDVAFDCFVHACIVIKLTEPFHHLDTQRRAWVQMNYDTLMHTVLSVP